MHFAACAVSPAPLRLLLGEWDVDRRVSGGADKRTPLLLAAGCGRADNVRLLMGVTKLVPADDALAGSTPSKPLPAWNAIKAVRVLLARHATDSGAPALKIGPSGAELVSRLLADVMSRVVDAADGGLEAAYRSARGRSRAAGTKKLQWSGQGWRSQGCGGQGCGGQSGGRRRAAARTPRDEQLVGARRRRRGGKPRAL